MASFIPENFRIDSAESVVSLFNQLIERPINSVTELEHWLKDASELESHISEDMAWRYIRMTCDTKNKDHESKYLQFVQEIQPQLAPLEDQLNRKIADCSFTQELENESNPQSTAHQIYFRGVRKAIEIFREENIEIQSELSTLAQEYSSVQGSMSIEWNGDEITLQKASNFLLEPDRDLREKAWRKIQERRAVDTEKLEDIFDQMVAKRHQMALNAGFENYRDYMFAALGRYDYTAQDCKDFHKAIEEYVVHSPKKSRKNAKIK
jgi:oligoendopeptidase F